MTSSGVTSGNRRQGGGEGGEQGGEGQGWHRRGWQPFITAGARGHSVEHGCTTDHYTLVEIQYTLIFSLSSPHFTTHTVTHAYTACVLAIQEKKKNKKTPGHANFQITRSDRRDEQPKKNDEWESAAHNKSRHPANDVGLLYCRRRPRVKNHFYLAVVE